MSTSAPWTLKNECANSKCQHEKDSHHFGKDNCLAIHCDCKAFRKKGEKEAAVLPVINRIDYDLDEEETPDTPRMPGFWGP